MSHARANDEQASEQAVSGDSGGFAHDPVMVREVVELLMPVPPGLAVDATVGGGGHAGELLAARPDLALLGLDRDEAAVAAARRALRRFGDRATVAHEGFDRLAGLLSEVGGEMEAAGGPARHEEPVVVAILFDLGVSSPQLDDPARGFSYRHDAPLDMRMDTNAPVTAADLVNDATEGELARIIRQYGEERFARAIARQIVRRRPLQTTGELVEAVKAGIPAPARRTGGHPARRTFQALRIAVNDELDRLEAGLDAAFRVLCPRGRLAVLSYHSLEDRIVKRRFEAWSTGGHHPPGLPTQETVRGGAARVLTRRPLRPRPEEVQRNPRAESARLRGLEKLDSEERAR
ncbi:MAG: 16S rRNA (cytosine(1402)-N(4))-methyltransferase RsmH [Actinobacteria bacterium]|nr:16S rRNA (cytosine(1402)-N(4))-methyltransferase RsmH [Actinomycetota bacterium]